jgi:hypothetical protein
MRIDWPGSGRVAQVLGALLILVIGGCGGGRSSGSAPSALSYMSPVSATVGTPITPLTPTVTGSVTSYSVSPALPTGLSLDSMSGVIAGTPTTATGQAAYTITAASAVGNTTFSLVLTVGNPAPTLSSITPDSIA